MNLSSLVETLGAHPVLAAVVAGVSSFGEALLIVGAFVPTTVILIGLGTLMGLGKLAVLPTFVAAVMGAAAGDALSFWAGRHWRDRIRSIWPFSRYGSLLTKGEAFIARHGGKSILIARFVPAVKAVVPILAGSMGMGVAWFTAINVASGAVWAAAQILPSMLVGRGLQVGRVSNPRALILAGLIACALVVAWGLARLAADLLVPAADNWRWRQVARLDSRRLTSRRAALARRLLANESGAFQAAALGLAALAALSALAALTLGMVLSPALVLSDAAVEGFLQSLRTDWATRAMVAATMLGDAVVLGSVALLILGLLALAREWRLAALVTGAFAGIALVVPLMKAFLHRARPVPKGDGALAYGFPSGHSTLAAVVLGLLALLAARAVPPARRSWVYGTAAALVALIAISRVYLRALWPSDVAAGLLFGTAVVLVMAIALQGSAIAVRGRSWVALLGLVALIVVPVHLARDEAQTRAAYEVTPPAIALARADWLSDGWRGLPRTRVLLDGDPGEAILLQTDLPLDSVTQALAGAGWAGRDDGLAGELLAAILPLRQRLMDRAPWPMTHLGHPPRATLVRGDPADPRRRLVLRIWATDRAVEGHPLLLASISGERLDSFAFGLSLVEEVPPTEMAAHLAGLSAHVLANLPGEVVRPDGGPALIAAPNGA